MDTTIMDAINAQREALIADVEKRFSELTKRAVLQFEQQTSLHHELLDVFVSERDAQIEALRTAFGTGD